MLTSAKRSEHPGGIGPIAGLTEEAAVQDYLGVGTQDHGRPAAELSGHRQGLSEGDRGDGLGRRKRRMLLRDVAGENLEGKAESPQELPAPRGGRGQDEDRGAQVTGYVTIRGFLSVMTRSFFSIEARRNFGRLNECTWACPSQ
jgi:hypothetical protein